MTRTELPTAEKSDRRAKPRPAPKLRYRVRLVQIDSSRSRMINVECNTLDEAGEAALEAAGEGWKVIKIDPA